VSFIEPDGIQNGWKNKVLKIPAKIRANIIVFMLYPNVVKLFLKK